MVTLQVLPKDEHIVLAIIGFWWVGDIVIDGRSKCAEFWWLGVDVHCRCFFVLYAACVEGFVLTRSRGVFITGCKAAFGGGKKEETA